MQNYKKILSSFVLAAALAAAPAFAQDIETQGVKGTSPIVSGDDEFSGYYKDEVNDPLETLNRGIFKFNEVVDFVLLKPPFKFETLLLWLMPFALLVLGAFGLWRVSASRAQLAASNSEALSEAEEAQLAAMLAPQKDQLGQKDG
jgi:hypothetical protein